MSMLRLVVLALQADAWPGKTAMAEKFEILGPLRDVRQIAVNTSIRSKRALVERFGRGRWRKMKGAAVIRTARGQIMTAELH